MMDLEGMCRESLRVFGCCDPEPISRHLSWQQQQDFSLAIPVHGA